MKVFLIIALLGGMTLTSGCGLVRESAKTVWGSSIRALEQARADGIREIFFCSPRACFDATAGLTYTGRKPDAAKEKRFRLFMKDPDRRYLVVMGVPGNVDTTEVGIFFDTVGRDQTRVEISSLSSSAVSRVGDTVFKALRERFSQAALNDADGSANDDRE